MCVCVCPTGVRRGLDTLELELQVTMNCLMWVLGTELGPSARVASTFLLSVSPAATNVPTSLSLRIKRL